MIAKRLGIATVVVAVLAAPASASAAPKAATHRHATYGIGTAMTIHRHVHHHATFGIAPALTIHR